MQRILIVAAHPDDEVLGCFGSVARFIKQGAEAYTLILGEGKTSRGTTSKEELEILNQEFELANKSIGIKKVFREYFPDNCFDSVSLLDIVKAVEKIKNIVKPNIIFTHFENDLNIDHKITYQAVLTATRPLPNECVKQIYSFEILSSTEWNFGVSFGGNVFFDISETIEDKIKAMRYYQSELCEYPHPRSLKGIEIQARLQGMRVGMEYAESFILVRDVRKDIELVNFENLNDLQKQLVFEWRNDANISKFMRTKNIVKEEHLHFIESLRESTDKKYFLLLKNEEPLGVIYFTNITKDSCEFGLYSNPNLKGVGYLLLQQIKLYAFNTLGVLRLHACAFNHNTKAIALYTKFGFCLTKKDTTMSYFELSEISANTCDTNCKNTESQTAIPNNSAGGGGILES
ncbi:UDP-4-amino-4,6-dideoxy-N-acetyl-beta-L-altrosamine N-acetyltransferase [Helicobacter sp. MIT 11-5569]|uniref:UDP-4-amino-4, 6-dideoxy-N-acetyl-beta-L-altrosamine N-acetyltransferase n=1 Tax=Helicobacter sp. MIT 11-5569 TaxID=1548151 RepID=UPI001375CEB4|nr:UDP-4-amino-4,6-dideoxy-N-acetyl-beta-L-altrosamine N-acetyltransferase [Helicobacter sp. MIT 11-5569]